MRLIDHIHQKIEYYEKTMGINKEDYGIISRVATSCLGKDYYLKHIITGETIWIDRYRWSELNKDQVEWRWHEH